MTEKEAKEIKAVEKLILSNKKPSRLISSRKEVMVRCCYCGDSKTDKTHMHMYIELTPPFMFYCHRCNVSGVLNTQTLRDLEIYDTNLSSSILQANKTIKKKTGSKFKIDKKDTKLIKVDSPFAQNAAHYFNSRFNSSYTNEEIVDKFKAVTNSADFFNTNHVNIPTNRGGYPLYDFNNSIGFLSSDASHVIFRDITGQQAKRYYNFNLYHDMVSTSSKLYNIKSGIDIMKDEITLIITEGVFDIIGVYEAFYKDKGIIDNDHIFAAAAGKGYNAVISHYIRMGFLNLKVIIYSDADVKEYFFKNLKDSSVYLKGTRLTIYYNTLEKDFGVPKDRIKLRRVIV